MITHPGRMVSHQSASPCIACLLRCFAPLSAVWSYQVCGVVMSTPLVRPAHLLGSHTLIVCCQRANSHRLRHHAIVLTYGTLHIVISHRPKHFHFHLGLLRCDDGVHLSISSLISAIFGTFLVYSLNVLDRHLRFAVWTQPPEITILAFCGRCLSQTCCH